MDASWGFALSLSGFLTIAFWNILYGRKIASLAVKLPMVMVFITLGILSLKYIDVLPLEYIPWFKFPIIIMCIVGGMAMLMTTGRKDVEDENGITNHDR